MIRKILGATLASAAIALAGPALAAPAGGGHAAPSAMPAQSRGPVNASPNSVLNRTTTPTTTTTNPAAGVSQGPFHASPTGIAHANQHSVLASGAVSSTTLPVTTGMTVLNSSGTTLGTISQVVTDSSGNIRLVIVTSSTGQTYRLLPTTLSISGGLVTTTSM